MIVNKIAVGILYAWASLAYVMAMLSNPGHIDYQEQKQYSANELNAKLFDTIVFGEDQRGNHGNKHQNTI